MAVSGREDVDRAVGHRASAADPSFISQNIQGLVFSEPSFLVRCNNQVIPAPLVEIQNCNQFESIYRFERHRVVFLEISGKLSTKIRFEDFEFKDVCFTHF